MFGVMVVFILDNGCIKSPLLATGHLKRNIIGKMIILPLIGEFTVVITAARFAT